MKIKYWRTAVVVVFIWVFVIGPGCGSKEKAIIGTWSIGAGGCEQATVTFKPDHTGYAYAWGMQGTTFRWRVKGDKIIFIGPDGNKEEVRFTLQDNNNVLILHSPDGDIPLYRLR
ncbi:hypothetical protein J7L13_02025 [bacterium]|nr:hypothetical protein [bacterium]